MSIKINLAKSAGFCFGVKRALNIALKTGRLRTQKVYMLGDIVHNEKVVKEIEKAGIKKLNRLNTGKNKILLIRAHGSSLKTINKAKRLNYKIVDATCPMVKEIHKIARNMEERGYKIIVIGDKEHDEVNGIVGQLKNKAMVIDPTLRINKLKEVLPLEMRSIKKAGVVVQSTQELEKVSEIVNFLKIIIPELKFYNTICNPTRIKQAEIKTMPGQNEMMIIIGSKTSANTRRLYEISKSLNKRSYWVSSKNEINPQWFRGVKSLGVSAGASTPDSTTQDIIGYIRQIT